MDKEKKEVNVHYIAVVSKQSNGVLELTKEEISNDYKDIIDRLDEMVKNPNRTVLDMQQCFVQAFPRKEFFDICWPRFYDSKYVGGVGYPKIYTYDEYKDLLKSKRESLDLCYSNDREKYKKIESALEDSKARLKIDFKLWCLRYIHGYNFTQTKSKIKNTIYDVIIGKCDIKEAIITTKFKNLSAVPATIDLAGAELELYELEDANFTKIALDSVNDA